MLSEAQRTLVKSPPELWAELSDAASLSRHLGELGEISITHLEPEQTVEWTAEDARGKIEITPSGWGTRVTLSVTLDAPRPVTDTAIQQNDAPASEKPLQAPEPEVTGEVATATAKVPPESEPGRPVGRLFKRLGRGRWFLRRRRPGASVPEPESAAVPEPETAAVPEPESAATEPETAAVPEPGLVSAPQHETGSAPEPETASPQQETLARTTELLSGVLDSLGEAHHRPFSRA
jgi:hypothetical protein